MAGILANRTVVLSSSRSAAIRRGPAKPSPAPAIALSKRRRVWVASINRPSPPPPLATRPLFFTDARGIPLKQYYGAGGAATFSSAFPFAAAGLKWPGVGRRRDRG